jgi:hypothetical protein
MPKKKTINIGFCPRCKEDLAGMMTRQVQEVVFCWLCSFDVEESAHEKRNWLKFAREYASEMVDETAAPSENAA